MKPDFTNFKGLSKDPILETNFENEPSDEPIDK